MPTSKILAGDSVQICEENETALLSAGQTWEALTALELTAELGAGLAYPAHSLEGREMGGRHDYHGDKWRTQLPKAS